MYKYLSDILLKYTKAPRIFVVQILPDLQPERRISKIILELGMISDIECLSV